MHDEFDEAGSTANRIDFKEVLLYGVARSRVWVLACLGLGTVLGLILAASKPNTYTSRAKLLLRIGDRERVTSEAIAGSGGDTRESRPTIQDELHMLSDAAIYMQVAKHLGPENVLRPADPSARDTKDTPWPIRALHDLQRTLLGDGGISESSTPEDLLRYATEALMENTVVIPERDSNVITVYHTTGSPERAQHVADELVHAFVERHRDQFSIDRLLGPGRDRLIDAKNEFEGARKAYFEHVEMCGFVDLQTQGGALLDEVDALDTELFGSRVRREEIKGELTVLRDRLATIKPVIEQVTRAVTAVNDEYETQISVKRSLLEAKKRVPFEGLSLESQRNRLKQYDEEIAEIDEVLAGLDSRVVLEPERVDEIPNPDYETLASRIVDLEVEDLSLGTRITKLQDRVIQKQERVAQMRQCEGIHEYLTAASDAHGESYGELNTRVRRLEALDAVDVEGEANLQVLLPATYDPDKDGPQRGRILAFGMFAGLLVGLAIAAARQLFDPHMRYPAAAERTLGIRTLAVIPETAGLRRLGRDVRRKAG